jgi:minor extracellular serine protease Vpr
MRFGSIRAAAAFALLSLGILGSSNSGAVHPEAVGDGSSLVMPKWTPLGVSKAPVTVVVQLAGDSVAEHQANAGRRLDRDEKERIKSQLKSQHDGLRGSIENLGGTVVANYRAAYNGIKVRIAGDRVKELAALPGVVAVRPLQLMKPDNVRGIPLIGTPAVWQNLGLHGEGVKIAIIDTGIDYTHANFGGPGTVAAFEAAAATSTAKADAALFGPAAPRVKGGFDFVGDDYDASAQPLDPKHPEIPNPKTFPHTDPNPLDCNGHGSHVAGTAAGSGITAAGTTYTGPYNGATLANPANFRVGPGVAPKADLYAVRVFGCEGSTDVVVDAIDWAVDNDMDVINMSLGSPFGSKDDPSAVASTNAAKAGVVVVASAGNSGPNPYITGSPASADGAISVAANDPYPTFPGATLTFSGTTIPAVNANEFALPNSAAFSIKVIKDDPATTSRDESLGCSVADFGTLPPNTIAVVNRGVCARVAKAIFGQQAGAAAVVMVNNAPDFPPIEGPITSNPDDGVPFNVTIPFLGVKGPASTASSDGAKLRAASGSITVVAGPVANPNFTGFASFSSGGSRTGDSGLKPDITAPGVSIVSTGIGTGNGAATISGTSMASPHVAGVAALTRQAHPTWKVGDIKAAIVNTGRPSGVFGYKTRVGGTGLVQPASSTATQVVARTEGQRFGASLNFGFKDLRENFHRTKDISLRNNGSSDAIFNVAQAGASGSPHSVSLGRTSVRVPAHGAAEVRVTLDVAAATAGNSATFRDVAGFIEFTPAGASDNGGVALRVPYYFVPRAQADVDTRIGKLAGTNPSTTATVTNKHGAIAGNADFYAWGIFDTRISRDEEGEDGDHTGKPSNDVRAIGVQSIPNPSAADPDRLILAFAVNTYNRWSNASANEFDIFVDVDGDGIDDYVIVGVDQGAVQLGSFNGVMGSFVFSTRSPGASIAFLADAPTDSSTALLFVRSSQLCRTFADPKKNEPCLSRSKNPRLSYHAESFDLLNGGSKVVAGSAKYNAWSSSISFKQGTEPGGFATVAPGATDATVSVLVNSAESNLTPALGVMVVTSDNKSGADEAQLIRVK